MADGSTGRYTKRGPTHARRMARGADTDALPATPPQGVVPLPAQDATGYGVLGAVVAQMEWARLKGVR